MTDEELKPLTRQALHNFCVEVDSLLSCLVYRHGQYLEYIKEKETAERFYHLVAEVMACRLYRYSLWRVWDENRPYAMFIGLNPSTAREVKEMNLKYKIEADKDIPPGTYEADIKEVDDRGDDVILTLTIKGRTKKDDKESRSKQN